jgi:hypothetical protein
MFNEIDRSVLINFFESRVSKVVERLDKKPSVRISFSRFRSICSNYFTKKESRYVLEVLAKREIFRYDCAYIYRILYLERRDIGKARI